MRVVVRQGFYCSNLVVFKNRPVFGLTRFIAEDSIDDTTLTDLDNNVSVVVFG